MEVYIMDYIRCTTTKQLLAAMKYAMTLNQIQQKTVATNLGKSNQSISQFFITANPQCNTIFDMLAAMNLSMEVRFVPKDDAQ
jgi:predicted XRE-type DNA-binding protein